jgi:hypothetical protein
VPASGYASFMIFETGQLPLVAVTFVPKVDGCSDKQQDVETPDFKPIDHEVCRKIVMHRTRRFRTNSRWQQEHYPTKQAGL